MTCRLFYETWCSYHTGTMTLMISFSKKYAQTVFVSSKGTHD